MKHVILSLSTFMIATSVIAQSWWPQTSNTNNSIQGIDFVADHTGFCVADTLSEMPKTTNQGFTWSNQGPSYPHGNMRGVDYTSTGSIFAVGVKDTTGGKGLVAASIDGGLTWSINDTIPEDLFAVSFANGTEGWISGENGYVARTADGGSNWLQLTTNTGEDLFDVYFLDNSNGWVVGTVDSMAVIYSTSNSGTNWTRQSSNVQEELNAVFFTDMMNGWTVGTTGTILHTTDGGTTWLPQTSGTTEDLFDVHFINLSEGWAVGSGGTILKTTDGGTTWNAETSGTGQDLLGVHMRSSTLGWTCGNSGTILVYGMNPPNGITENQISSINIYPNPVTDQFVIEDQFNNDIKGVQIVSMDGSLVFQNDQLNSDRAIIDCQTYVPGIYTVMVKLEGDRIQHQKIVVQ